MVAGLRLVEASIVGITFVQGRTSSREPRDNRLPLVRTETNPEPMPLKSMGDGLTRLLQVMLSLVNATNGVLLIDEFENGLHWSVQSKVWESVFRMAMILNVQVFATTHSRDCIIGFQKAWTNHQAAVQHSKTDTE